MKKHLSLVIVGKNGELSSSEVDGDVESIDRLAGLLNTVRLEQIMKANGMKVQPECEVGSIMVREIVEQG